MPAESEPPELGRVIGGKYRIDALLGRGGMGAVYAATNELTGKRVAVKRLLPAKSEDPNAAARFLREARIAARVEHPNVINVFDVGRDDDTSIFLVMELLDGTPLSALIREGGMEIERLIDILLLVMRGVQHAHDAGVVHRDLKPANLFVMADGNAKVLDFGIGALPADEQGLTLTRTGMVLGTPLYMAPEQITAVSRPDARSDQYALGVVLYKGLTGRLPFQAENYTALAVKIAVDVPIPPRELRPEIPPALEDAVLRAIARKPEERFDSVRDFAAALEPFGSKSVAHAKESTPSEAAPSTPIPAEPVEPEPVSMTPSEAQPLPLTRVPRWAIAVAALALLGLVAFGVGLAGPFDDADPVVPAPATTPPTAPAPEPAAAIAAPLPVPEPAPAAPAAEPTPEEEEPVPASPPSPRATSRTSRRTARSSGEAPTVPEPSSGRRVPHVDEAEF